jgi:hypothetical protein
MDKKKWILGILGGIALLVGILIFAFSVGVMLQDVELPAIKIQVGHE